jgi:hypothetical protein
MFDIPYGKSLTFGYQLLKINYGVIIDQLKARFGDPKIAKS